MFANKTFSFTKHFKVFGIISIVLVIVGLVALILQPFGVSLFNFDIDFVGGTTMQFEMHTDVDRSLCDKVSGIFSDTIGFAPSSVTKAGDSGTQVIIKSKELSTTQRDDVFKAVAAEYDFPEGEAPIKSDFVSASVGSDLRRAAILASVIAIALILVYIAIRFQLRSGVAAVIALVHDLLVMLSMYVIFQIPFNINFIAAALTILGYSINATIVVFDRIRENKRLFPQKDFSEVVDMSIWQTMGRSINTTVTTLFPILLLLILGVSSVRNFALPLTIGILSGCYSSVCISGSVWNLMMRKSKKRPAKKAKKA